MIIKAQRDRDAGRGEQKGIRRCFYDSIRGGRGDSQG